MTSIIISLPIADRRTSFAFYGEGLGFEAIGEPADDGVPEPLQFALNDGINLMLVPTGGFGWVIGDHDVAEPERKPWGYIGTFADPDEHLWMVNCPG